MHFVRRPVQEERLAGVVLLDERCRTRAKGVRIVRRLVPQTRCGMRAICEIDVKRQHTRGTVALVACTVLAIAGDARLLRRRGESVLL